ncbi:MAG TPA: inositol monophosphatase family protein [Acidobacteriota bacterium]|nr:inositol monophosphatase family protein [Acidobacteriota bacterium]
MERYRKALNTAIETARLAGEILLEEFHRSGGPRGSAHHAEADDAAEDLIRRRLLAIEPWNYLGEETGAHSADSDHLWLVDPNDGTFAYMRGMRGSAVSIAVLRGGVPVLGVVYAYSYPDDNGDLIAWAEGCGPVTRNGQPVDFSLENARLDKNAVVFLSQDADKDPAANLGCVSPARFRSIPSIAYRMALVAVGEGVAAVSLNGPCSWDFGAAHALMRGAGGTVVDESGVEVSYARDGRSQTRNCFGGAAGVVRELAGRSWGKVLSRTSMKDNSMFGLSHLMPGRAIRDVPLLARAQGCLLGQFAGDALGSQVEFQTSASIRSQFPDGLRDLDDGGMFDTIGGQPTDDSEMALMLARCLVREGEFDAGAVMDAYLYWQSSDPFDLGVTTGAALGAAQRGNSREERLRLAAQSAYQDSEANGSLMRVSPLGIFGWARPHDAAAWACEDSDLTHPNRVCREACASFVRAIAAAISGADAQACYRAALQEARRGGTAAITRALEAAAAGPPQKMDAHQSGWALLALQNAFYRLLHSETFEDALVQTVACGGDTDTNAAICGALLGAVHGRDSVPARWRRRILTCRPMHEAGALRPRPIDFWPVDAYELAELLLLAGV